MNDSKDDINGRNSEHLEHEPEEDGIQQQAENEQDVVEQSPREGQANNSENQVASYLEGMVIEEQKPRSDSRNMDDRKYWNYKDVLINPHGEGVPDEVFLEGHFQDRMSEKEYGRMKKEFTKERSKSKEKTNSLNMNTNETAVNRLQISAEALAESKGKHVPARHPFRVVRQHASNRNPDLEADRYRGDRMTRSLRKDATCTLSMERARELANYIITPEEVCHLFRITESPSRLNILKHTDVQRKDWFLHLCRRTWETTGHRVIGLASTRQGVYRLREKCGIETWSSTRFGKMMYPSIPIRAKHQTQRVLTSLIGGMPQAKIPLELSRNTVLVVGDAEKHMAIQLDHIMETVKNQGGKLIFVESKEEQRENHKDTAFHDIAKHLDTMTPDYSLQFYRDVSQKLIRQQEPMLTLQQQNRELTLDR